MSEKRRDSKNRILRTGESQEADGRYKFRYIDANGKRKSVYSWRLVATDSIPAGKRDNAPLREQEKIINRDIDDSIVPDGGGMTVLQLVKKYTATKTGVKHTMATKPMTREHLQDFVDCYCSGHMEDRNETYDVETNPNGRWRRFSAEDVKAREDLNFKWLDFTEEDDRSVADILDEMQDEADGISAAVAQLKELLGGIEI